MMMPYKEGSSYWLMTLSHGIKLDTEESLIALMKKENITQELLVSQVEFLSSIINRFGGERGEQKGTIQRIELWIENTFERVEPPQDFDEWRLVPLVRISRREVEFEGKTYWTLFDTQDGNESPIEVMDWESYLVRAHSNLNTPLTCKVINGIREVPLYKEELECAEVELELNYLLAEPSLGLPLPNKTYWRLPKGMCAHSIQNAGFIVFKNTDLDNEYYIGLDVKELEPFALEWIRLYDIYKDYKTN